MLENPTSLYKSILTNDLVVVLARTPELVLFYYQGRVRRCLRGYFTALLIRELI
jgi:hypothetical protein